MKTCEIQTTFGCTRRVSAVELPAICEGFSPRASTPEVCDGDKDKWLGLAMEANYGKGWHKMPAYAISSTAAHLLALWARVTKMPAVGDRCFDSLDRWLLEELFNM